MFIHSRVIKIMQDIRARKARTILVSLSIFIGVLGVVTLFSMGDILIATLEETIDQKQLSMLRAYTTLKGEADIADTEFLTTLREQPGVTAVQAVAIYPAYWKLPTHDNFSEGRIFSYSEPFDQLPLQPVELLTGRWPSAGNNEIVVERRLAKTNDLKVGSAITLRILSEKVENGTPTKTEDWTITGIAFHPYPYPIFPGGSVSISGEMMIFAPASEVEYITGAPGYSLIEARFDDYVTAKQQAGTFEAAIANSSPYIPFLSLLENPAKNPSIELTRIFNSVLSLLALVALVVSGFLVLNVINATVIEQRRQIGIMKSLGATGWDNFMIYAGLALSFGVIGTIPGVLLGIPMGYSATENIAAEVNILVDDFMISWQSVLIGAILGIVIPVAAAVVPVLMGIRVTILEAITDLGIQARYGESRLARAIDMLPIPIDFHHSLRNVVQKRGRLTLTIITLTLAAGAFMGVYAALTSFTGIIENVMDQIGIDISVNAYGNQEVEYVHTLIEENIDGLRGIEPGTTLSIDIDGYKPQPQGTVPAFLIASGINVASPHTVNFELSAGTAWQNDPTRKGVVISAPIARTLKKVPGDTITLRASGQSGEFEVIGVSTYSFDTVWMRWQDLSTLARLVEAAPVPNEYQITVAVNGVPTTAIGVDQQARMLPFTAGEMTPSGEPGIIISATLAEREGFAVGSILELKTSAATREVPVTGIFTIPPFMAQAGSPDAIIAIDWQELALLEGRSLDGKPVPNTLQLFLDDKDPTAAEVKDKIDAINAVLLKQGITAQYTNWVENTDALVKQVDTAGLVLNIAAMLIGAVGAIGLLSVLSMSVFERQKEIGVMRSIGASSNVVALQFMVEGLIVGLVAWVLGVPLSYLLNDSIIRLFGYQNMEGASYPAITPLLGLILTLTIATVASLWPSITAARKTVSDILRYQ